MCAFIHSFVENKISVDDYEVPCTELCPCRYINHQKSSIKLLVILSKLNITMVIVISQNRTFCIILICIEKNRIKNLYLKSVK